MIKSALMFSILLSLIYTQTAHAKNIENPKQFIFDTLKQYSPTGYHILSKVTTVPREITTPDYTIRLGDADFMMYVEELDELSMLDTMNIVVHEMCHDYLMSMVSTLSRDKYIDFGNDFAFYIGVDEDILVRKSKTFPSYEMRSLFPKKLRTFRFDQYIGTNEEHMGTQKNGIYGLLNELNAYYHGTKAMFDIYPYFKNKMPQTRKTWEKFIDNVNDSMLAYYEFKLYILKYLQYAKDKYPDIYKGIDGNTKFKDAYNRINSNFFNLAEHYKKVKVNISEILNKNRINSEISNGKILINSVQVEGFAEPAMMLEKELQKDEYKPFIKMLTSSKLNR